MSYILAIETSCDDTSVALLKTGTDSCFVTDLASANQDDSHRVFGGVVPEVASRCHTETLLPMIDSCLQKNSVSWGEIEGIAVTSRPGLIGSLLVGVITAKTLSYVHGIPLIGVNHIEGHLVAALLTDAAYGPPQGFTFPYLGLVVSGGHTSLFVAHASTKFELLGYTLDDAAGEAFDKFAKMMGLGFPGGVKVDQLSKNGNTLANKFPRGLYHEDNLNFSFSGLKSSAQRLIDGLSAEDLEKQKADLCASYQEAIVDVLVEKLVLASHKTGLKNWTITGGVSANTRLRELAMARAQREGAILALPPLRYCTDNAAMIGFAGYLRLKSGAKSDQTLSPSAGPLESDYESHI